MNTKHFKRNDQKFRIEYDSTGGYWLVRIYKDGFYILDDVIEASAHASNKEIYAKWEEKNLNALEEEREEIEEEEDDDGVDFDDEEDHDFLVIERQMLEQIYSK